MASEVMVGRLCTFQWQLKWQTDIFEGTDRKDAKLFGGWLWNFLDDPQTPWVELLF